MADTVPFLKLTHDGALKLVEAALAKSLAIGARENIVVVDSGGNMLAMLRMDGANTQAIDTAWSKALTAAARGQPTGTMDPQIAVQQALASHGKRINLPGGFPIVIDGHLVGGIGIGGGSGEEDIEVAKAALGALSGTKRF
jgi:uncharacterized protein GlcG (DUF336 family)